MIRCEDVAYVVRDHRQSSKTILHPLSFQVEAGAVTLVRGRSGAGKSTLLSIVAGVLRPTQGQVLYRGEPVSRYTAAHRDRFRQRVGLVAQRLHLFDELTPIENVLLPFAPRRSPTNLVERAMTLLCRLELTPDQPLRSLSGGEQQRVAIARALVTEPELLALDEPTAHQDPERVAIILALIREAVDRGCSVFVTAHDPRLDQGIGAATVLTLEDGKLVAS